MNNEILKKDLQTMFMRILMHRLIYVHSGFRHHEVKRMVKDPARKNVKSTIRGIKFKKVSDKNE